MESKLKQAEIAGDPQKTQALKDDHSSQIRKLKAEHREEIARMRRQHAEDLAKEAEDHKATMRDWGLTDQQYRAQKAKTTTQEMFMQSNI